VTLLLCNILAAGKLEKEVNTVQQSALNNSHIEEELNLTTPARSSSSRHQVFNARLLLEQPKLLHVVYGSELIRGITVVSHELFILQGQSPGQINVYNTNSFNLTRNITIPGSRSLFSLCACPRHTLLFTCDSVQHIVYRYNLTDNITTKWTVGEKCYGLSVTRNCNILVTLFDLNQIKEYTPDGKLTGEITVYNNNSDVIEKSCQSVRMSNDMYIVNDYGSQRGQVCKVDWDGRVIQCYKHTRSSPRNMKPVRITLDSFDSVLVAYMYSGKVEVLSPTLVHLGYIAVPGYTLDDARVLYLDELNHRLYIGEYGGRVFALTVDTEDTPTCLQPPTSSPQPPTLYNTSTYI